MNIVCVICSDLLIPSDDVFHTPCGHIFHFACLTQWLERSRTCPQCREKTISNNIHRVYFNFSNNDTITEDASCLQDRVDKLNFQILLRDKDIKHYREKSETYEKQCAGLRKEVKKVESEVNEHITAIHALKEQVKYFKQQSMEVDTVKQEVARLKKKVEDYRNIQILLDAPPEEVDDLISKSRDPAKLITYISVIKREMTTSLNKRRELRSKVKNLQQMLTKVSMERNFLMDEHEKRKKLDVDLAICESEKMSLQNKLRDLERNVSVAPKQPSYSESKPIEWSNSSGTKYVSDRHSTENLAGETEAEKPSSAKKDGLSSGVKENGDNSPYLPVKSHGVYALKEHSSQRRPVLQLGSSILSKKSRLEHTNTNRAASSAMSYDGFGGHSKYDQFPTSTALMRRNKLGHEAVKPKRRKLDKEDNQKLRDFVINVTR